jgi:hypothetical protein
MSKHSAGIAMPPFTFNKFDVEGIFRKKLLEEFFSVRVENEMQAGGFPWERVHLTCNMKDPRCKNAVLQRVCSQGQNHLHGLDVAKSVWLRART